MQQPTVLSACVQVVGTPPLPVVPPPLFRYVVMKPLGPVSDVTRMLTPYDMQAESPYDVVPTTVCCPTSWTAICPL